MTKKFLLLICLIPFIAIAQKIDQNKNILIVVSSYGKDLGKSRPGFEFDEYSQAYLIFKSNNLNIDVASPKGGIAEPDEYNKSKPYNLTILKDTVAMGLLKNTKTTASINGSKYDAIYIVGGKGAMFDLPFDPSLQEIVSTIYSRNGIVSAVCHGPAAFANVKLANGEYLIANKKVSGFSNEEEIKFGKKWKSEFPFLLEDKLIARGGIYEKADVMLPQISISGNLITGQNPYSTNALAEEIVKALNKKIIPRKPYADEKSMNLVNKVINENAMAWAKEEILNNKESFDIELIAVYGYYRLLGAENDTKVIKLGIDIIELATPFYYNSNLQLEQAKAYKKLGNKVKAKQLLEEILVKEPGLEKVKKELAEL